MITEADLGRLLIYQAEEDEERRLIGMPTIEEDLLNLMEVRENLQAMLDPFPWPPSEFARRWESDGS